MAPTPVTATARSCIAVEYRILEFLVGSPLSSCAQDGAGSCSKQFLHLLLGYRLGL
jgi:hypothetical protein